jgi:hypothetical protein
VCESVVEELLYLVYKNMLDFNDQGFKNFKLEFNKNSNLMICTIYFHKWCRF